MDVFDFNGDRVIRIGMMGDESSGILSDSTGAFWWSCDERQPDPFTSDDQDREGLE